MITYAARGNRLDFAAGDTQFNQVGIRIAGLANGGFSVIWAAADADRTAVDGDMYGLTVGTNLIPVSGPQTLINDTGPTSSYPLNQAIVGLASGGFAVISTDNARYSQAAAAQNREAAIRLYDNAGASAGTPIYLGVSAALGQTVEALSDGRLITGWVDTQGGLKAQYLSATGMLIGSAFQVAQPAGDFASRPTFASTGNGGWVATYIASGAAEGRAIFYNSSGQASADQLVAASVTALQGIQVERLADGRVVMMWASLNQNSVLEIHAQIYSDAGARIGGDILVSNQSSSITSVAALADGGFVAVLEPGQSGPTEIRVFNSLGQQAGDTIALEGAFDPDVTALAGGGFAVAWKDADDQFHAQAYAAVGSAVRGDINGDGRADILWRNDDGSLTSWLGLPNGAFVGNDPVARVGGIPTSWKVAGLADIDGDGLSDILWRNDSGALTDWLGQADGSFIANDVNALIYDIPTSWKVAGLADFNGDQRADILWRNDSGALTNWLGRVDGGFTANDGNALIYDISTSWKVAGAGDFNGDGRSDILWRNDNGALTNWLANANGSFSANDPIALIYDIPVSWKVAGIGDFNGDGRDDVLWRNDSGALTNWLSQPNGSFSANDSVALIYDIPTSWKVANVADVNGDGRDDLVWRNDNGGLTDWLAQANGGFVANDAAALTYQVSTSWRIQPDTFALA